MKTFEINLQHGKLTWDAAASSWLLFWVHQVGIQRTEHSVHVGGSVADDAATLGRLVGRAIPRDLGPITGTVWIGTGSSRIEIVGSQVDSCWNG